MKEKALNGSKISASVITGGVPAEAAEEDEVTTRVLIMASFAKSPEMTAAAAFQLPKPSGANMGAQIRPIDASMLSSPEETGWISKLYDWRNHISTDAVKITVNAFLTKPRIFSHTRDITLLISGI